MILEPKRSYILDLVDFSEDDPLLRFAAYASIVTGISTLLVGFLACCGAIKAERCMVVSFLIFLVFIFFAEISIGVLGILYREKFTGDRMEVYLSNMSHNRYYRDKWVLPLMDTIQFYLNCCGSHSPSDWLSSQWRSSIPPDSLIFDPGSPHLSVPNKSEDEAASTDPANLPIVPDSCCVQMQGATVNNRIARSLIRCQQPGTARLWRHQLGCHERLQHWFNEQTILFAAIGFAFAAFQIIGMCVSVVLWRRINDYLYVDSYER
uniref:Tetraspanin n=1 Tax=Acrobeloides nanus TaxID=290746 RepID=A0A914DZ07_9BILA